MNTSALHQFIALCFGANAMWIAAFVIAAILCIFVYVTIRTEIVWHEEKPNVRPNPPVSLPEQNP